MPEPRPDSEETVRLIERMAGGDTAAAGKLLARYRDPLRRFVAGRLDAAIRTRVDPSDVVQDALAEVTRRLPDYLARRHMPFHLWVWKLAYERALQVRRIHRADCRNVGREVADPDQSSLALIHSLVGASPTPSEAAMGNETARQVAQALADLPEADREILLLREVDRMPYEEIGPLLDVEPVTARKRYGRALIRLEHALAAHGVTRSNDNDRPTNG